MIDQLSGLIPSCLMILLIFGISARSTFVTFSGGPPCLNAHAVFYRGRLLHFSFETLTTCGFGDLVPLHPVVRSLANLERRQAPRSLLLPPRST